MKVRMLLFTAGIILLLLSSCDHRVFDRPPQSDSPNRIMPLGASRVEGNRPEFESFRYELWKKLIENGWSVDFIGTRSDEARYPEVNGSSFDRDHQGVSGWTSGEILAELPGWLEETGAPDIVLFSSPGGNDALQALPFDDAVSNINAIIDLIQEANPEVRILMEQMAPGTSGIMTTELSSYIAGLHREVSTIAAEKATDSSELTAVDMFTGFSDDLLADDVHYNEAGARFIADRYYAALEAVLVSE